MRQYEDLLIDALLDVGFTIEEALNLIALEARIEHERRAEWEREMAHWLSGTDEWDPHDRLN